jgi:gliding motility-associated-like protein
VNALPTVSAGLDTAFCSGGSINIGENAEGGFSYSWLPVNGLNDSLAGSPVISLLNPNTGGNSLFVPYKVIKTNNTTACRNFDSLVVEVKPLPIAVAASSDTLAVCSESDLQLGDSALAAHVYSWLPDTAISSASASNPVLNATNPSQSVSILNYQINVTNSLTGCKNKDLVAVKVNPLPIPPLAYADTSVCTRDTLVLGGNGENGIVYAWSPSLQLNDSSNAAPQFSAVNNSDTVQIYSYQLLATNSSTSCRNSRNLAIAVNPLPDANAGPDLIFCSRDSVQIGSSPVAGFRYQWSPVAGLSNPFVSNPKIALVNDGTDTIEVEYTVQVWDSSRTTGCDSSDKVMLRVKPSPLAIAYAQDTLKVCATISAQLGISGDNQLQYSWSPAQLLSSATVANPIFTSPVSPGSSTLLYVVSVTNPVTSCQFSDSVDILVNPLPIVNTGSLDSLCSGDTIQIGPGIISVPNLYAWGPLNGLSGANPANPFLTLINNSDSVETQTYQLIVTNQATGCQDSASLNVRVNPLPVVDAGADRSICSGESTELGQAAQAGFQYSWDANSGIASQTIANPSFSMTTDLGVIRQDTLSLLMTNSQTTCKKRDEVVVTTNPRPAPIQFALFSPTVCPFSPGIAYQVLNPDSGAYFQWSITGGTQASGDSSAAISVNWGATNPSAEVKVFATNMFGCTGSPDSIQLAINQNLTPVTPFGDTLLCSFNKTGRLYNTAGTLGSSYIWSLSGATISSDTTTTSQLSVDWTINDGEGLIWIQEQSSTLDPITGTPIQCFGQSDTLRVRINPSPDSTLDIQGVAGVCANPAGIVEGYRLSGYPGSTYQWLVNPAVAPILNGQGTDSIQVNWQVNGNYQLIVTETSDKGCVGIPITKLIRVNPLPVPGLSSLSVLTICPNDLSKGYIAESAPGFSNSTYSWSITGGTATTATNQKLLGVDWGSGGNYKLVLTETSAQGCSKDSIIPLQYDASALLMKQVSLLEEDENKVEIRFEMQNKELNPTSIDLWRKEANGNNWVQLVVGLSKDAQSFTDEPLNTSSQIWQYKITSGNLCQKSLQSDIHQTIVLSGSANEQAEQSNLAWNPYIGWASPGPQYTILRGFDETNLSEYETGIGSSAQPAAQLKNAGDGFIQWYRIKAEGPDGEFSFSNKIRLDFQNKPGFYNLITPNGDGANEGFVIKNLELYPDNELVITNRWGDEVFRKKNYNNADSWKGSDLEDGVYYYKFTAPSKSFTAQGWIEIKR